MFHVELHARRLVWLLSLIVLLFVVCAAPTWAEGPRYYTLGTGETLEVLARRLGLRVETLLTINAMSDLSLARSGQRILIPERQWRVPHVVRAGETLGSIAKTYGLEASALAQMNGLTNPDRLEAGQTLTVTLSSALLGDGALPNGPVVSVMLSPWPARQGQTVSLWATTSRPVSLTVTFAGREMPVVSLGAQHWALLGVHPMAAPGFYPVGARAADSSSQVWEIPLRLYVAAGEFPAFDIVIPPSTGKDRLLDPKLIQDEMARLNAIFAGYSTPRRWAGVFSAPLPASALLVSSVFGERRSYNGGPVSSYHEGIDYAAPGGTPVFAPAAGIVALAEALDVRGNAVILDHGYGVFTGYWHLREISVKAGAQVRAGDVIGKVGTTGLSTGDHLHWELRVNGTAVDPAQWMEQARP